METSNTKENTVNEKTYVAIREARIARKIVASIILVITLAFTCIGLGSYIYIKAGLQPAAPDDKSIVKVTIPIGSSGETIGNILQEKGIIKDARIFRYYVKFKNESGFMAGDYKLSPSMKIQKIVDSLKTGTVIGEAPFTVTIPEGKQLEEIATIIDKKTSHSAKEFLKVADDKEYLKGLIERYPSLLTNDILTEGIRHPLEGYLFPSTYEFHEKDPSIENIIEEMVKKSDHIVSAYKEQIEKKDLTVHELITMASLIEKEASAESDRTKIAGVFYNRINVNMPLQTDPTVLYALGKHTVQITKNDLKIESPYNTYIVKGLPIGPITNPGEASIEAALNPEESNSLYFYARPSGEVLFSDTLEEHNEVKEKYKHEWDELKK